MAATLANQILGVLKEGLSAWKKYISTRQEAYERHMDKKQEKAIQTAEYAFEQVNDIFIWIFETMPMDEKQRAEFGSLKKKFLKTKEKFNKYD